MNKDHSELIEYLDKKFAETAKQKDLDDLKEQVRNLVSSVDKLIKAIETYHQEQVALSAKVDRHEKWINQIAAKMGVELNP